MLIKAGIIKMYCSAPLPTERCGARAEFLYKDKT